MNESAKSGSIAFSIFSINKILMSLSQQQITTKISNGLKYMIYLKSTFGYWLPEIINV